jgi:autotransporter translocation and assembly factor TamB
MVRRSAATLIRVGLWATATVVVLYTGVFFYLDDLRLGGLITRAVSDSERGTFTLRHARYRWAPGLLSILFNTPAHVVGEDFELRDPDHNLVLKVPYVETDAYLQETVVSLAKYVATRRFHLTLHFARSWIPTGLGVIAPMRSTWGQPKGEVNIVAAMSAKRPNPPGGEFRIVCDDITIDHVDFAMGYPNTLGKLSWYARVDEGAARASLIYSSSAALETAAGPYFFFKIMPLVAGSGVLQMGEYHFPLGDIRALEFGPNGDRRQDLVFRADVKSLDAEVHAEGALTDSYSEHPGVKLTLQFKHGGGPLRLLPSPLNEWLAGEPEGTVRIDGPFSGVVIDGDVRRLRALVSGLSLTDLAAHLKLAGDRILRLEPLTGRFAHGTLGAAIEVGLTDDAWWRARLKLRGVDPAEVALVPRALAPVVAGSLDGTVRLGGSLVRHPERIWLQAIEANLTRSGAGRLPRLISLAGALDYAPAKIDLKDLRLGASGVTLAVSGSVDPALGDLSASLRVDGAHASAALHGFGLPARAGLDALHAEGTVRGRWPRPTLALHVSASNLGFADRVLDRVEADLSLAHGTLKLDAIRGAGLGGSLDGHAALALFDGDGDLSRPLAEPSLTAALHIKGVSLARLVGPVVDGAAEVTLNVDSPLAHPRGLAEVKLPSLSLWGDPYRNGRAALDLGEDGGTFRELSIERVAGGRITGAGKVGYDGTYDLKLEPSRFPIAAIPNVSKLPFALAGTLSGHLEITGDENGWMPGGEISLTGFRFRSALLGDGRLKLDAGGDASHVTGTFFSHLSVEGYFTPVPKLTVTVTINFQDMPLETIFPEMQQLADVRGRATGQAQVRFNLATGLSAALTLSKLELTLSGTEEDGRTRHLVVSNRTPVVISSDGASVVLRPTRLTSTLGEFNVELKMDAEHVDARMRGDIGLELIEYFFRSAFDHTDGNAYVDLAVTGDPQKPSIQGAIDLRKVVLLPRGLEHRLNVLSGHVDFTPAGVSLRDLNVLMDGAIAHASGTVALDGWRAGAINGRVQGDLSAKILQWLFSDKIIESSGKVAVDLGLEGQWNRPKWRGSAHLSNLRLQVRRFDQLIAVETGSIDFVDYDITLGCPRRGARPGCQPIAGTIGDTGRVELGGFIGFGEDLSPRQVDLAVSGTELHYANHQYALTFSPTVRLSSSDGQRFNLAGEVNLVEGRYTQKFDVKDFIIQPRAVEVEEPFWQGDPRFDTMTLAVHVQSRGSLYANVGIADLGMGAVLDVSGTLSEPRLRGQISIDEGGSVKLPIVRIPLVSDGGHVYFDENKKIPAETPTIDFSATGVCTDRFDNQHNITLVFKGTISRPLLEPRSQEGWDQSAIGYCLLAGRTQDDLRKLTQGDPSTSRAGVSASEGLTKSATGTLLSGVLSDPLRRVIGFDVSSIEIGQGSVDVQLCKRFARQLKTCGHGEIGFLGTSRVQGQIELRLSDYFSALGRVEYLSQGIDTAEETTTRAKLELNYRIPLGY